MSNLAIVIINSGSFDGGFRVDLRIRKGMNDFDYHFNVAAAPDIPRLYEEFATSYHQLGSKFNFAPITMPPAQITNCSLVEDCQTAAERLQDSFILWLAQFGWQEIRLKIENTFKSDEFFRVIFHFDNIQKNNTQIGNSQIDSACLKKLPWHLWDLFENRENTYFALSLQDTPANPPLRYPVRILAVFGGSDEGLKLKEDKQLLNSLRAKGAEVTQITKPTREQLSDELWNQKWDVLFFAGHSSSHPGLKSGELAINDTEHLSLRDLKQSLKKAVKKGLKLAIFNSCDGLGLAAVLDNVKVPQIIVMRELVPDEVARKFLQYFLECFTTGKSLYSSVREACERLEALEGRYPCASWLPVIYQNRNAEPLRWSKRSKILSWLSSIQRFVASTSRRTKILLGLMALSLFSFVLILVLQNYPKIVTDSEPPKLIPTNKTLVQTPMTQAQVSLSSYGQKFFTVLNNNNNTRENGAKAFKEALDFLKNDKSSAILKLDKAINYFSTSLSNNLNDPEARIYLNNAISYYPKEEYSSKIKFLGQKLDVEKNKCTLPQSQNNPIEIAVVIPLSFAEAAKPDIALEMLRGVAQVQNEVNCKGGIKDRMLRVAVFGDGSKDDLATKVAQEIVQQDFLAVVGHSTSNTTAKAGNVYDENRIVAISPISTAVRDSVKNHRTYFLGKYIFRTPANDMVAIDTLFDYWKNNVNQKFAIAYSNNSEYSKLYRNDFINKLNDKSLYFNDNMKCIFNSSNFDQTDCLNAIRGQAGALLVVPGSNDSPKALDLLKALNDSDKIQVLGGDTMYSSDTLYLKEKSKNLIIAVHWLRNRQQPTEFEKQAKAFWGNAPINWRTATTYDATKVITTALDKSQQLQNSKENIRQDLQRIISAPGFSAQGAFNDNIRFEEGDRKIDANSKFGVIGKVEKIGVNKDGQDQYDFKPI
ncbi:hypothetical protein DSM106972_039620 [Dulcicalothrix desertica PCC 7102]|uniref:ABC transporter substrate-binding protein n=1 Tax=Dulcicalothrix desertica PCC 7102 TaxID=232991 RepID=A0A433VGB4_9CYAN|nr:ABC transporter substrate-binding protein [Dulcicalothrix desertica]RUT05141.1 hypothetical protein DSM106972_039620 [Dulcicalothrix desertica PCC 7102]TWH43352.1 branched-chain amino acid transport system substrate-binding protein [Dulcicalothrix desertica PCC 7102]